MSVLYVDPVEIVCYLHDVPDCWADLVMNRLLGVLPDKDMAELRKDGLVHDGPDRPVWRDGANVPMEAALRVARAIRFLPEGQMLQREADGVARRQVVLSGPDHEPLAGAGVGGQFPPSRSGRVAGRFARPRKPGTARHAQPGAAILVRGPKPGRNRRKARHGRQASREHRAIPVRGRLTPREPPPWGSPSFFRERRAVFSGSGSVGWWPAPAVSVIGVSGMPDTVYDLPIWLAGLPVPVDPGLACDMALGLACTPVWDRHEDEILALARM